MSIGAVGSISNSSGQSQPGNDATANAAAVPPADSQSGAADAAIPSSCGGTLKALNNYDTITISPESLALQAQTQAVTPAMTQSASQEFLAACAKAAYGTVDSIDYVTCLGNPIREIDFGYVAYDVSSTSVSLASQAQQGAGAASATEQAGTQQATLTEEGTFNTIYGLVNFEIQFTSQLAQSAGADASAPASSLPTPSALIAAASPQASTQNSGTSAVLAAAANGESMSLTLVPVTIPGQPAEPSEPSALLAAVASNMGTGPSTRTFGVLNALAAAAPSAAGGSAAASAVDINSNLSEITYGVYASTVSAMVPPPEVQLSQSVTTLQGSATDSSSSAGSWNATLTQSDAQFIMNDTYTYGVPDYADAAGNPAASGPTQGAVLAQTWNAVTAQDVSAGTSNNTAASTTPDAAATDGPAAAAWQISQEATQSTVSVSTVAPAAASANLSVSPAVKIVVAAMREYATYPNLQPLSQPVYYAAAPSQDTPVTTTETSGSAASTTTVAALSPPMNAASGESSPSSALQTVSVQSSKNNAGAESNTAQQVSIMGKLIAQMADGMKGDTGLETALSQSQIIIDLLDSLIATGSSEGQTPEQSSGQARASATVSIETHSHTTTATFGSANAGINVLNNAIE